jgi:hypothetical protein
MENDHKSPTVDMLLRQCRTMKASASQIIARIEQQAPTQDDVPGEASRRGPACQPVGFSIQRR